MKLAIILILGMISCIDIGHAPDGYFFISNFLRHVQSKLIYLRECEQKSKDVEAMLYDQQGKKNETVLITTSYYLFSINVTRNLRPRLIKERSQHCYTDAENELEKPKSTALQKLQNCVYAGQSTIKASQPDSVIKEGNTLFTKLSGYISNESTNDINRQNTQRDYNSFMQKAGSALNTCYGLSRSISVSSGECFRKIINIFETKAKAVYEKGLRCIKLVKDSEE